MKKMFVFFVLLCCSTTILFAQRSNVEIIYDYLYVFPKELGTFDSEPVRVIEQLNANSQYGYKTWRLPNNEELALLKANGYAKYDITYMTNTYRSKSTVLLVTTKGDIENSKKRQAETDYRSSVSKIKSQTGYVDLGLPSGVKWAAQNYGGEFKCYSRDQIESLKVPSQNQWLELKRECNWTWDERERGYIIKGRNGNAIFLNHTDGYIHYSGGRTSESFGIYWSSTWIDSKYNKDIYWTFGFNKDGLLPNYTDKSFEHNKCCVRLISY